MEKYRIALLVTYLVCSKLNAQTLQTITQTGNTTNRLIQITAQGGVPTTGAGLELFSSNGGDGNIGGFDRGAGLPTNLRISQNGGNTYINPASGNVGVGTYSPLTKLHVNGSLTSNTINLNESGTNIGFLSRGASVTSGWAATPDVLAITYIQHDFAIGGSSKSDGSWKGASIYINSDNGLVGIGTTAPQAKLDVNGNLNAGPISSTISGADIGGYISLRNPAKTTSGAASTWKIMNMSGSYGNSLQFWAYDDVGCGTGLCSNRFTLMDNGNVGIGTVDTKGYKLAVNGSAVFIKAVVKSYVNWPDYVFDSSYQLKPLSEIETFIRTNKHLPDIPSAAAVNNDGIDLGENQTTLLKKIEELTLYLIDEQKSRLIQSENIATQNEQLKEQLEINTAQNKKMQELTEQNQQLKEQVSEIEVLKQLIAKQQDAIEALQQKAAEAPNNNKD